MMELDLDNKAEHEEHIPKVFEAAGGFAPTIGIIGAVLGLIQVMQHLDDITEVGRGIAVAFVATIYGVVWPTSFFSFVREDQNTNPATASGPGNDPRGSDLDSGRHEPADARDEAERLPRGRRQG